jgi:hypothetical protein
MNFSPLLVKLFIAWIIITVIWLILFIYRGMIGRKEEDQVFLTSGEERLAHEQEQIAVKLKRLSPYLKIAGILSLLLLLAVAGLWIYEGLKTVNM